jgi:hypothetical protein
VSEAVFVMDDGGSSSSDAGRPRLPGVCIVDVDSNAEPYWLLLVFLPKRARVCSNQLTACPINTGALISVAGVFATAASTVVVDGLTRRSLARQWSTSGSGPATGGASVQTPDS